MQIGGRHFDLKLNSLLSTKHEGILRVKCSAAACLVAHCHHSTLEKRMHIFVDGLTSILIVAIVAKNLGIQSSGTVSSSPIKRIFSRKALIASWANEFFAEFAAAKRSSEDELERYLLGFASIHDIYEYFVEKVKLIENEDERGVLCTID